MTTTPRTESEKVPAAKKGEETPPEVLAVGEANKRPHQLGGESKEVNDLLKGMAVVPPAQHLDYSHWMFGMVIQFEDRIYGGKPLSEDLISPWLESRLKKEVMAGRASPDDLRELLAQVHGQSDETREMLKKAVRSRLGESDVEEIEDKIDELADTTGTQFLADETGFYIEAYQLKAGLKLSASITGLTRELRGTGSKVGMKDIMQHLVHIFPAKIYLAKYDYDMPDFEKSDVAMFGKKLSDPGAVLDATESHIWHVGRKWRPPVSEAPGHVSGPTGERSILKRRSYVAGDPDSGERLSIAFAIKVAKRQEHLDFPTLCWLIGEWKDNGAGADRSQGGGRFAVTHGPAIVKDYDNPRELKLQAQRDAAAKAKKARGKSAGDEDDDDGDGDSSVDNDGGKGNGPTTGSRRPSGRASK